MDQIEKQVRRAQWRLGVRRFIHVLGWFCCGALVLALLLIAVDKFRPLGVEWWGWCAGALLFGVLAAAVWAVVRGRGPLDAAVEIDREFSLKERVSSVVAMSEEERQSELGQALVADTARRISRIDVKDGLRLAPERQLLLPLVPGVAAVLVALFVSPMVVGNPAEATSAEAVKKQVKQSAEDLRRKLVEKREKAEEKGLEEAEELFKKLEQGTEELTDIPKADRKNALVELNDLNRQIAERRDDLAGSERIRDRFQQLNNMPRGPADKFLQEVRRGNFEKAMEQLDQLKAALAEGDLTKEESEELAKQLEQMKEKLEEMVKAQEAAMEDLQQRMQQARLEGRDEEADRLEEMLDALRQQMPQINQVQNMADAMGRCAKCLRDGRLADADGQFDQLKAGLDDLQRQLEELELLDDAMAQLDQCRNRMNCPHCGGMGCGACQGMKGAMGMKEGRGAGPRPEAEDNVGMYNTKSPVKIQEGEATVVGNAGWSAIRGNVDERVQEQYESTKRELADPLTGQRLPKKVHQGVQEYFDDFRQGE